MRLFDIIKTAQQTSGTNIITLIKDVLSKTDQELLSLGLRQDILDKLKAISTKTSMSDITIKDLSPLLDIPSVLRPTNFDVVVKHAQAFIKGKISDQFVQSGQPALQGGISPVDPTPSIGVKSPLGITNKNKRKRTILPTTTSEPNKNTDNATKEFKIFEFMDKSEDKNWKQLVISPKAGALNFELVLMLSKLGIISVVTSGDQPSNNIQSITKDKYVSLISSLKKDNWSTDLADINAESHLLSLDEQQKLSDYAEVKAKSISDEYNNQWMYLISVPNMPKLTYSRQKEVVECFTFAFVGMTDNPKYSREISDEAGNRIQRKRLCRITASDDIGATKSGWLVRGDPSDFQRFSDICNSRNIDNQELTSLVLSDFQAGKFYDPKKKTSVDPKTARFEGIIDGDGYESEADFVKEVELVANEGLRSKALLKAPGSDVSNIGIYPMQIDGVKFLYSRTHAILGDDTGVGKTAQAITAGHLRLKTDTKKMNKDMKAIVITKSSVVPQFKRDISNFTGIPENEIYTGDELFEDLMKYDHPTKILDENGTPRIPIPNWKWCILNYEKFSVPPRPQIVRNTITRKQNILSSYTSIMDKALTYSKEFSSGLFNAVSAATAGIDRNKRKDRVSAASVAALKYIRENITTNTSSLYLNQDDSSWYKEKDTEKDVDSLARSTAANILLIAFSSIRGTKTLGELNSKISEYINTAKTDRQNQIIKFIERQELRIKRTGELDDILYRLQDNDLSDEERYELTKEKELLERIKGSREGGLNWGEDGKRNILTAYFSALSKLGVLDVVILDEVHTVKNGRPDDRAENTDDEHDANFITFNTQIVTNGANNVWGASATVIANKEQDLYNQLRAINSPLGDLDYKSFVTEMSGALGSSGEISVGTALRDVLVQSKIYLQRTKHDILEDIKKQDPTKGILPPQKSLNIDINNSNAIDNFRSIKTQEINAAMARGTLDGPSKGLVAYGIIRRSLAKAKAESTVNFAIENLQKGERVGIFTDNKETGYMIKSGIERQLKQFLTTSKFYNKKVYFLSGDDVPDARMKHVDEFMKDEAMSNYAAMVISFNAGGTGLSMENSANIIIFNDLPQTPVTDVQAKGRFYRINSLKESNVYYMLLNVEEDTKLYDVLHKKIAIAEEISKLSALEIQYVINGQAKSEIRQRLLAKIYTLEAESKAIDAEAAEFKKSLANLTGKYPSQSNRKKAYANCWYKKASNIEIWY